MAKAWLLLKWTDTWAGEPHRNGKLSNIGTAILKKKIMSVEFSIVLPCYNEAESLPFLLERFSQAIPENLRFELVMVNNGSTDNTGAALMSYQNKAPHRAFLRAVTV